MSKIAFLASFLAAFITMDAEIFGGEHTRAVWRAANDTASAADAQLARWSYPVRRR